MVPTSTTRETPAPICPSEGVPGGHPGRNARACGADGTASAVVSRVFSSPRSTLGLIRRELRLHQWLKNLLVFVALLTSHQFTRIDMVWKACVAFFAFGMMASSAYIINDVSDLQSDRKHPRKRNRPFASGALGLPWAFAAGPGLFLRAWD